MRRILADERGMVASYMVKVILVLAILGVLVVEGGSVVFARLQVQDIAESAAAAGAAVIRDQGDVRGARNAALISAHDKDENASVTGFQVFPDGRVQVTVQKRANTLVIHQLDFLKDLTVATATATESPPAV